MHKFTQPSKTFALEPRTDVNENKEQLTFCSKGLTADDVHGISSLLANTKELDLSDNAIDKLSRGFPLSLVSLNLSSNKFANLTGFESLRNIRVLKLQRNKIASTWGMQECIHLEHLDLTHNRIKVVEGLELLTKLKTLFLDKNYIESMEGIRSLSFNISLEALSLRGNRVTIAPNYRGFTKHLIASLQQLDGKSLYLRDGNRCPGYGERFACRNAPINDIPDTETVMTQINSHLSVSTVAPNIPPPAAHLYFDHSFSSEESVISASSSQQNETLKVGEDISDLPWRRPPSIVPKDVKGRELYDTNLNISSSKHKSRNKSESHSKGKKHRHHHRNEADIAKPTETVPPPPEKWDDNFIYESHGSPSKRVTGANRNGRARGGGGSGVLSKAILGSRHYSTPPPPPRKMNKYPLTLGVEKPGIMPLSDATVMIGNEATRVPLLASPGMVERLSPKKQSNSITPLFPGAEQYWEGHVESLEHQEQNLTKHFREQVIQQQKENIKTQQRIAPPPPLPSEQSENQYVGDDDESEDYDSETASREYPEDDDEYSHSDDQYDHNSARDFDDSREYHSDDEDEFYNDDGIERHSQSLRQSEADFAQNSALKERQKSGLTSQRRGTFFGLYSKNTPEVSRDQKIKPSVTKTTPSSARHGNNPVSRGDKLSNNKTPGSQPLTSQRRGTFFGLYKKDDADNKGKQSPGKVSQVPSKARTAVTANQQPGKVAPATKHMGATSAPSAQKQNSKVDSNLTSQRRGTFFGLYKKNDQKESEENKDQNQHQTPKTAAAVLFAHNEDTPSAKSEAGGMTSQRRGTFFGLYKKNEQEESDENRNQNQIQPKSAASAMFFGNETAPSPVLHQNEEVDIKTNRDSPEELQNVLQQMYEKKIETLRNLKASREQQPSFVNN